MLLLRGSVYITALIGATQARDVPLYRAAVQDLSAHPERRQALGQALYTSGMRKGSGVFFRVGWEISLICMTARPPRKTTPTPLVDDFPCEALG